MKDEVLGQHKSLVLTRKKILYQDSTALLGLMAFYVFHLMCPYFKDNSAHSV